MTTRRTPTQTPDIYGVLIQWGDRLYYQGTRVVEVLAFS